MHNRIPQRADYPRLGKKPDLRDRLKSGLKLAEKAAEFLREKYAVRQVYLFGSLLEPERFHSRSDIDLAVTGLPEKFFYQAVGEVLEMTDDFTVDIIDLDSCSDGLKKEVYAKCRKI
jgi:predicted nucleotidyltransferase